MGHGAAPQPPQKTPPAEQDAKSPKLGLVSPSQGQEGDSPQHNAPKHP